MPVESPLITVHIALGSNLGDRAAHLHAAIAAIAKLPGTTILRISPFLETEPVGPVSQPLFLNAAAALQTRLSARDLLNHLLAIERSEGRQRQSGQRWGPRTLDLDLLLYGDAIIESPDLTIPHPRLHERMFVLGPLAEISPDVRIPVLNATIRELKERLDRQSGTFRPSSPKR